MLEVGLTPDRLLDTLPEEQALVALLRCCGSPRWAHEMLARRPFGSPAALRSAALAAFRALERDDWLAAFAEHPAIGAELSAFRAKFAGSAAWSHSEQAGAAGASETALDALRALNRDYRNRFGFTFIVCATGKSATEMLAALNARLANDDATELSVASREQEKITELRLGKLVP
jgi:2-oxo-4-hydroxy-4-carboxy-5-ureidoimidazoline decarboxylase